VLAEEWPILAFIPHDNAGEVHHLPHDGGEVLIGLDGLKEAGRPSRGIAVWSSTRYTWVSSTGVKYKLGPIWKARPEMPEPEA
jgi:hypothetical protein